MSKRYVRFDVGPDGKLRPMVDWFTDNTVLTASDLNAAFAEILLEVRGGQKGE